MSKGLTDELQALLDVPREYFTIEHVDSMFIMDGKVAAEYPIINVYWFDRGQVIEEKVAKIITRHVQAAGYKDVDVIFTILEKSRYYENGEHF